MKASVQMDGYHELGYLAAAHLYPSVPLQGWVMRERNVTTLPFPSATGFRADSGSGFSLGIWTDAFNAMPAVLLLRP